MHYFYKFIPEFIELYSLGTNCYTFVLTIKAKIIPGKAKIGNYYETYNHIVFFLCNDLYCINFINYVSILITYYLIFIK
jgi:hypothetical protein